MPLRQGLFALLLLALVSACSSDVKIYVAPVPEVDNQFEPDEVWSARVGDGVDDFYTRLRPAVAYGKVFAASRFGDIEAFDAASGESLWQTDVSPRQPGWLWDTRLDAQVAGGLSAQYGKIYLGTERGLVIALDAETADMPLRFFLVNSSVAAVHGAVGQSDYAAANAFMDRFMADRAARVAKGERSGHSLSIGWTLWADGGMRVSDRVLAMNQGEVLAMNPDGIFLSNGPGDPAPCDYAIKAIEEFLKTDIPVFGICLGHQLLALASGAKTLKMKFGHHGGNHPVQNLDTKRVLITAQNHGFAVDEASLPANLRATHKSLFDGTLQGIHRTDKPAFSFQGHPEASPGPHEASELFDHFIALMQQHNAATQ